MKFSLRSLLVFLILVAIPLLRAADPGTITGRVSNAATGAYLDGAEVAIDSLGLRALTGRDGAFSFSQVPFGTHAVRVSYIGLGTATNTAVVSAARPVVDELAFGLTDEVYKLGAFTVAGEREGNAAAITRQRNADNVMNTVSMDAYGNVADGNIGNFMQRLPGVSAIIENGDLVGFGVRGQPS